MTKEPIDVDEAFRALGAQMIMRELHQAVESLGKLEPEILEVLIDDHFEATKRTDVPVEVVEQFETNLRIMRAVKGFKKELVKIGEAGAARAAIIGNGAGQ